MKKTQRIIKRVLDGLLAAAAVSLAWRILNRYPEDPGILIRDNWKMIEKFGKTEILAAALPNGGFCYDKGLSALFE